MIHALIIENEPNAQATLVNFLRTYCPEVKLVAAPMATVEEGNRAIYQYKPDLVFLDIELHDGTGLDLLDQLPIQDFELIFVTAYEDYALDVIQNTRSCDYLIKPYKIEALQRAVSKAAANLKQQQQLSLLKGLSIPQHRIVVPNQEGFELVPVDQIIYCQADKAYTRIYLKDAESCKLASQNLKHYERLLSDFQFMRIHRSYLINLNEVVAYKKGRGGYAVMSNEQSLEVAADRKKDFIRFFR